MKGGTGLRLSLVYEIISDREGTVEAFAKTLLKPRYLSNSQFSANVDLLGLESQLERPVK